MEIVTGYKGEAHITAWQDRDVNQGAFGNGNYILGVGSKMAATVVNANSIRIADGALCMNGAVAVIQKGSYDTVAIDSGSQGMLRRDLIVARYTRNTSTGVENIALAVIKGTPTSGTPTTPSYTEGDIQAGDTLAEFPLYRVNLSGINVSTTRLADILLTGEEILAANALLNALDAQFDVWSDRLTAAEGDITSLQSSVSSLNTSMNAANTNIATVQNTLNKLVVWKSYTRQYTAAAGATVNITATQFGFDTPSGYATLGPIVASTGNGNVFIQGIYCNVTGSSNAMIIHNVGSSSVTATATIRLAYIKGSVFDAG